MILTATDIQTELNGNSLFNLLIISVIGNKMLLCLFLVPLREIAMSEVARQKRYLLINLEDEFRLAPM